MKLYHDIYNELYELLGEEKMLSLYSRFRGQQISFPTRLYDPKSVEARVAEEYDGTNLAELSQKYNYTEKSLRRMLKKGGA